MSELMMALLTERDVNAEYKLALGQLRAWRCKGGGPIYCKIGRSVRYLRGDVEDFISSRRRKSTSDPGGGGANE